MSSFLIIRINNYLLIERSIKTFPRSSSVWNFDRVVQGFAFYCFINNRKSKAHIRDSTTADYRSFVLLSFSCFFFLSFLFILPYFSSYRQKCSRWVHPVLSIALMPVKINGGCDARKGSHSPPALPPFNVINEPECIRSVSLWIEKLLEIRL